MEDGCVTRESEDVAVDPKYPQGFRMPGICYVNSEEGRGDLAMIRSAAEYVNEAVGHRHGVVEQIGRRPRTPRFDARPQAISVAEQPELIRRTMITEAATKHYKVAGDRGRAALVERRRSLVVLENITASSKATQKQELNRQRLPHILLRCLLSSYSHQQNSCYICHTPSTLRLKICIPIGLR